MNSPITGQPMTLKRLLEQVAFRKELYSAWREYWYDPITSEEFQTEQQAEHHLQEVYNQYREAHNLPFPFELVQIREKYGLNPTQISLLCGFGPNTWRSYEAGEVPSDANARLIRLNVEDPEAFVKLIQLSTDFDSEKKRSFSHRIKSIKQESNDSWLTWAQRHLRKVRPTEATGFAKPNLPKFLGMLHVLLTSRYVKHPNTMPLCKLPFYADFLSYALRGASISGLSYARLPMGPVPDEYKLLLGLAMNFEVICEDEDAPPTQYTGFVYKSGPKGDFYAQSLSEQEQRIILTVAQLYGHLTSSGIKTETHKEEIWNDTPQCQHLSYVKGINTTTYLKFVEVFHSLNYN